MNNNLDCDSLLVALTAAAETWAFYTVNMFYNVSKATLDVIRLGKHCAFWCPRWEEQGRAEVVHDYIIRAPPKVSFSSNFRCLSWEHVPLKGVTLNGCNFPASSRLHSCIFNGPMKQAQFWSLVSYAKFGLWSVFFCFVLFLDILARIMNKTGGVRQGTERHRLSDFLVSMWSW